MTTDRRPVLAEAPDAVRAAVAELLGAPIVAERAAAAGFTPSIASIVAGRGGRRLFVEAAPVGDGLGEAVAAGVVLAGAAGDLGPRLAGAVECGDWRVAAYEVVDGVTVDFWTGDDLVELLSVAERMRDRLEPCPIGGVRPYARDFVPLLGNWTTLGVTRPPPVAVPVTRLAELESRWLDVLAPGGALHHGDLRRDNVIREPGGRLRIVDWTHLWTAPGWMDLIRLLPDLAACGHDPEAVLRRSCWRDVPADDVNVALAGLSGRAWRDCARPGEPRLRRMQREQAEHLLAWLDARLRRG
ncbi:aminoglycoside phosphotransferase [Actinoplanes sp. NPDC023801]|uniref:aminoglycoside phosphotransferase n=1 Tax=Actinoplanes sp. NPDC023801 TaxID=3154595 RepID=UPI0033FA938F